MSQDCFGCVARCPEGPHDLTTCLCGARLQWPCRPPAGSGHRSALTQTAASWLRLSRGARALLSSWLSGLSYLYDCLRLSYLSYYSRSVLCLIVWAQISVLLFRLSYLPECPLSYLSHWLIYWSESTLSCLSGCLERLFYTRLYCINVLYGYTLYGQDTVK